MTPLARLLSLRVDLRDEDAAAEVTPARLAAYLAAAGWTHEASTTHWHIWTRAGVLVKAPIAGWFADHGMVMLEMIRDIAAAEGRSSLAVWAELVGLADHTAVALAHLDAALAGMVSRPEIHARTPEALLLQALLALETRALLRGEPDPSAAYDAARARRRIPVSQHACDRLTLAGVAALVGEVAGMPPPTLDVAPGEALDGPDGLEPVAAAAEPSATTQEMLPGFQEASAPRRSTRHVFGGFEAREYPSGPLAPDATVTALTRTCRHCLCLHRVTSSGPRLGAEDLYSTDGGETWTTKSPPCHAKRPRETR